MKTLADVIERSISVAESPDVRKRLSGGWTRRFVFAVLVVGCSRPPPPGPAAHGEPASSVVWAPSAAAMPSAVASTPAVDAGGVRASYPVGGECSTTAALAREKRTLPPADQWDVVRSTKERIAVRVPPGVFRTKEDSSGLSLVSSVKAKGLGPEGKGERPFAIRFHRADRSIDDLLADTTKASPLAGVYVEGAFPKRTSASFVPQPEDRMGPGAAVHTTIAGKPAWVWLNGAEGYNADYVLVELGPNDTLFVVADWNSSVMVGQPECWQRAVIGAVIASLSVEEKR